MPHFFIEKENIKDQTVLITTKSDINHIANVLRYGKKDQLILKAPENKVFEVAIRSITHDIIECEIISSYISDKVLNLNITLAQSIIKSQKQDFLIQKATELGVKKIIPFISKNTVVKLDSEKDKAKKIQRWQKIVYESAKQCQRGDLAQVHEIINFNQLLSLNNFDLKILCSEKKADISLKQFLSENKHNIKPNSRVLLITGPEGGWDDTEIERFLDAGITPLTLGKLIYRAETAVTAALAQVVYEYEF